MPRFQCECGYATEIPDEAVGKKAKCPGCKQSVQLHVSHRVSTPVEVQPPPRRHTEPHDSIVSTNGEGDEKLQVLSIAESRGFKVEVLAWKSLDGCKDVRGAESIYFANQAGIRLKQVRVTLNDGEAILEAGALHYMHGRVEMSASTAGVKGLGKALANKVLAGETAARPRYTGTGILYLEPSFSHFLIHDVSDELIVDKGMYYCSEGSVDVGIAVQKNISTSLFGGEGWFQTRIAGQGICVLECPVPADEVRCVELRGETLQVDGNFALMRTRGVDFTVKKSSRGLIRTLTGGEGILQTFHGTGKVWLAPTQAVYDVVAAGNAARLQNAPHSSNTATQAIGSLIGGS